MAAAATIDILRDKGHTIRIVTQRANIPFYTYLDKKAAIGVTIENLHCAGIEYHDLCFVEDKTSVTFDILIEDAPHHISSCNKAKRNVLIMDYPYNRHCTGPRVKNWSEIHDYFKETR